MTTGEWSEEDLQNRFQQGTTEEQLQSLDENQFLKARQVIKTLNVVQYLKEYGIEETIDEVGEIWFQWGHGGKGQIAMGLSGYTEDEDEEIKADLVMNWTHIQKERWDQVKGLQFE